MIIRISSMIIYFNSDLLISFHAKFFAQALSNCKWIYLDDEEKTFLSLNLNYCFEDLKEWSIILIDVPFITLEAFIVEDNWLSSETLATSSSTSFDVSFFTFSLSLQFIIELCARRLLFYCKSRKEKGIFIYKWLHRLVEKVEFLIQ